MAKTSKPKVAVRAGVNSTSRTTHVRSKDSKKGSAPKQVSARVQVQAVSKPKKKIVPRISSKVASSRVEKKIMLTRLENSKQKIVISDETKKSVTKKLDKNAIFSKKVPSPRIPAKRPTLSLAIRSPFRFPAVRTNISYVARFSGIFIAVIGSVLSLFNLHSVLGDSQNVSVVRGNQNIATVTGLVEGTTTTTTSTVDIDESPSATIRIDAQTPLKDTVPVLVNVPIAEHITILAKQLSTGTTLVLGDASKVSTDAWQLFWDTRQYQNGDYKLLVNIRNQYTTYSQGLDTTFSVSNTILTSMSTSTTSNSLLNDVVLDIQEPSPLRGGVTMKIHARPETTKVQVFAVYKTGGTPFLLGAAVKDSDEYWKFDWNSENLKDDNYYLFAKVYIGTTVLNTNKLERAIDNSDEFAVEAFPDIIEPVSSSTPLADTDKDPKSSTSLSKANPVSNYVEIGVSVPNAQLVEFYVIPQNALRELFIGSALKISSAVWKYAWNTSNIPNGEYVLKTRIKNQYGIYEGESKNVSIYNIIEPEYTLEQEKIVEDIHTISTELVKETDSSEASSSIPIRNDSEDSQNTNRTVYIEPIHTFVNGLQEVSKDTHDNNISTVDSILNEYRKSLDTLLIRYAQSIRGGNTEDVQKVKNEIETLKNDALKQVSDTVTQKDVFDKISTYISQITFELQGVVEKNQKIIDERIANKNNIDSDNDGILDFDEVNLYRTNPFSADTDGDGYTDNAELMSGNDPTDPHSQALLTYESAKDAGALREDIFAVESISTIPPDNASSSTKALITGKGLPYSYVNLYIYSTPIVVSVKTDAEGSWSYVLDKEIENGNHEIYVGITDNTGTIVAKSAPFPFVKTAEAFAQTNPFANDSFENITPSFLTRNSLLLISSVTVVALGIVLMLLGVYASNRKLPKPIEVSVS